MGFSDEDNEKLTKVLVDYNQRTDRTIPLNVMEELVKKTELTLKQVKKWFENKRRNRRGKGAASQKKIKAKPKVGCQSKAEEGKESKPESKPNPKKKVNKKTPSNIKLESGAFSPAVLTVLLGAFDECSSLNKERCSQIATDAELTPDQVTCFFKKERKRRLEAEARAKLASSRRDTSDDEEDEDDNYDNDENGDGEDPEDLEEDESGGRARSQSPVEGRAEISSSRPQIVSRSTSEENKESDKDDDDDDSKDLERNYFGNDADDGDDSDGSEGAESGKNNGSQSLIGKRVEPVASRPQTASQSLAKAEMVLQNGQDYVAQAQDLVAQAQALIAETLMTQNLPPCVVDVLTKVQSLLAQANQAYARAYQAHAQAQIPSVPAQTSSASAQAPSDQARQSSNEERAQHALSSTHGGQSSAQGEIELELEDMILNEFEDEREDTDEEDSIDESEAEEVEEKRAVWKDEGDLEIDIDEQMKDWSSLVEDKKKRILQFPLKTPLSVLLAPCSSSVSRAHTDILNLYKVTKYSEFVGTEVSSDEEDEDDNDDNDENGDDEDPEDLEEDKSGGGARSQSPDGGRVQTSSTRRQDSRRDTSNDEEDEDDNDNNDENGDGEDHEDLEEDKSGGGARSQSPVGGRVQTSPSRPTIAPPKEAANDEDQAIPAAVDLQPGASTGGNQEDRDQVPGNNGLHLDQDVGAADIIPDRGNYQQGVIVLPTGPPRRLVRKNPVDKIIGDITKLEKEKVHIYNPPTNHSLTPYEVVTTKPNPMLKNGAADLIKKQEEERSGRRVKVKRLQTPPSSTDPLHRRTSTDAHSSGQLHQTTGPTIPRDSRKRTGSPTSSHAITKLQRIETPVIVPSDLERKRGVISSILAFSAIPESLLPASFRNIDGDVPQLRRFIAKLMLAWRRNLTGHHWQQEVERGIVDILSGTEGLVTDHEKLLLEDVMTNPITRELGNERELMILAFETPLSHVEEVIGEVYEMQVQFSRHRNESMATPEEWFQEVDRRTRTVFIPKAELLRSLQR